MKKLCSDITYRLLYGVTYLVSLLPYKALYVLSDLTFLLVYHVIRYRRKVVARNLASAFPNGDNRRTEKRFYHWLCDYFFETMKLLSVKPETLLRHIEFRNLDQVEAYFDRGKSCAAMLGHYCNWEYLTSMSLPMKRWKGKFFLGLIYHPLSNKAFDRLFIDIREHNQGTCVPKKDILRKLVELKKEQRLSYFGYILDQSPKWENIHLWLPFLNHDTPVFTGAERIIRKMQNVVFYMRMERPCRGKYVCTFEMMTDQPLSLAENELTRRYFEMLEADIRRAPEFYLWTHDRWKRTHEAYNQLIAEGKLKAH